MPTYKTNTFCISCEQPILKAYSNEFNTWLDFDVDVKVFRVVTIFTPDKRWENLIKQQKTNALPIHLCRLQPEDKQPLTTSPKEGRRNDDL